MMSAAVSIAWRASTPTCAFAPDIGNNTPMTTSGLASAIAGPAKPASAEKDSRDAPLISNCLRFIRLFLCGVWSVVFETVGLAAVIDVTSGPLLYCCLMYNYRHSPRQA